MPVAGHLDDYTRFERQLDKPSLGDGCPRRAPSTTSVIIGLDLINIRDVSLRSPRRWVDAHVPRKPSRLVHLLPNSFQIQPPFALLLGLSRLMPLRINAVPGRAGVSLLQHQTICNQHHPGCASGENMICHVLERRSALETVGTRLVSVQP